ncbi:MAG: hypothetical protein JWL57_1093 [Actinobacteria bacterium]|nr:hypothetical protein [Actinomycetota bacterium]
MSVNRLTPLLVLVLAVACSGAPKVSTTTSTSSPTAQPSAAASPGGFRRGGLAGTVTSFDGATLVLATRQGGPVKVQTSGSTAVTKTVTGTVSDIVPDVTVVVSGPVNPDGSYAASTVVIGATGNRGGFGGGRAGTAGTVKAVNGAGVVVTTAQGSAVTIVTSASTVVTKTVAGALSDLVPSEAVTVTGPQNADGTYTATRIVIGGRGQPGPAGPSSPVTGA